MTEGFKGRAKRLERASRENMIAIAQKDGGVKLVAIRNARDPQWANMWSDLLDNDADEDLEDLSELCSHNTATRMA
jgi:hypothetical protein